MFIFDHLSSSLQAASSSRRIREETSRAIDMKLKDTVETCTVYTRRCSNDVDLDSGYMYAGEDTKNTPEGQLYIRLLSISVCIYVKVDRPGGKS
jgi:hypothetical protein